MITNDCKSTSHWGWRIWKTRFFNTECSRFSRLFIGKVVWDILISWPFIEWVFFSSSSLCSRQRLFWEEERNNFKEVCACTRGEEEGRHLPQRPWFPVYSPNLVMWQCWIRLSNNMKLISDPPREKNMQLCNFKLVANRTNMLTWAPSSL